MGIPIGLSKVIEILTAGERHQTVDLGEVGVGVLPLEALERVFATTSDIHHTCNEKNT